MFDDLSTVEQDARDRVRAQSERKKLATKGGSKQKDAFEKALASDFCQQFDVGALAGRGGFSSAYRATEKNSGRDVVLKITDVYESAHRTMCAREGAVLAALAHPNVVRLYAEATVLSRYHVAVLEALEGPGVEALVDAVGALPEEFVVVVARDAGAALRHLHSHGVLHRDVKSDNVLCVGAPEDGSRPPGRCVLIDFGLARTLSPADVDREAMSDQSLSGLDMDLSAVGNALFSAPEVRFGARAKAYAEALAPCTSRYGVAADAYSLGRVLKLALTGQLEAPPPLVALCSRLCARRVPES